ncbi:MAG: ABC transporter permease [Chloroflexi bacterium]|nr:ABC transporter permease [Chloroflexota bacterium]
MNSSYDELGKRQRAKKIKRIVSVATIVFALTSWYLFTTGLNLVPTLFFPSPSNVLDTLIQVRNSILQHTLITMIRVIASFLLGSLMGMVVGLLMSRYQVIFALLEPPIEALRPIPPIALIPFFILWFGIGDFGKLLLAGIGCFMVMVISTIEAVRNVPRIYTQAAQSLGADDAYTYRTVVIPAIVPELIAGWRVALALAFALMIAAELMGAQSGLGFMIMVARRSLNTPTILLGIIIIGILAFLVDRMLNLFANRLTRWTERTN